MSPSSPHEKPDNKGPNRTITTVGVLGAILGGLGGLVVGAMVTVAIDGPGSSNIGYGITGLVAGSAVGGGIGRWVGRILSK